MSFAQELRRSIKALQFACLGSFVLIVLSGLIVLWAVPGRIDILVRVLSAIGPYAFPMYGFAFLGSHVKNLSEAVKTAIETKAQAMKSDDLQGVVG